MAIEIKVPAMGESITEATIASWLKQQGEPVEADEPVVELETDKVSQELYAPATGVLAKIHKQPGETVTVDEVIAEIDENASGASAGGSQQKSEAPVTQQPVQQSSSSTENEAQSNDVLPPAARKLIEENNLKPEDITGTGKNQQILKEDVLKHLEQGAAAKKKTAPGVASPQPAENKGEREKVVPMSRLRQAIARRLVEAQHTAAILTTFNEVDMSQVMNLRSEFKEKFEKNHQVRLGFMSFFVKAVVEALKQYPAINAEIRDNSIVYKNYYDIGVAVGGPKGLVVPVVRNADKLSFAGIEAEINSLASKVNDGSITLADLEGGTFSISNGGIYGSMMSTPILNPPQSGILGMHNITRRPVAEGDNVVIKPMMYLALSYDHRIVDGKEAVQFLVKVKEGIEKPVRMLLEV